MTREHIVLKDDTVEVSATLVPSLMIYAINFVGNNMSKVASLLAEMCTQLEARHFNKFWVHCSDNQFSTLMPLIQENSKLNRYVWYDEDIVPKGQLSKTPAYNLNRTVNNEETVIIRVFVLRQEERILKFKEKFGELYTGTLPEDIKARYGKEKEV